MAEPAPWPECTRPEAVDGHLNWPLGWPYRLRRLLLVEGCDGRECCAALFILPLFFVVSYLVHDSVYFFGIGDSYALHGLGRQLHSAANQGGPAASAEPSAGFT